MSSDNQNMSYYQPVSTRTELMRHSDLVDFESEWGEKRRQHRSVSEAFQRSSGSKDAEQDGTINFVWVLKHKFFIKTLEGFKVKFIEAEDASIKEVLMIQPNGTFKATRK